ncbi:MAG: hypothetical protein ABSG19_03595 [Candidatus Aminicenantales bacterium]
MKGVDGLYEDCCDGGFYDWVFQEDLLGNSLEIAKQHICMAPIFYKDNEILCLKESSYDPIHEEQSMWKIDRFGSGSRDVRLPHRPYKFFQLETEDDLMVLKCKVRPVLIIEKAETDWSFPENRFLNDYLCLPLFSYKRRHSQRYVFADQSLECPHRFYFPEGTPGLDEECAGLINEPQFIPKQSLYHKKCFCDSRSPNMSRPFRLTDKAFQAVVGHVARFLPGIDMAGESLEWYSFFAELVKEEISKIIPA